MDKSMILSIVLFVLGIPIAFVINLATPKIKDWFGSQSLKKAKNRKEQLEKELSLLTTYSNDRNKFFSLGLNYLLKIICLISMCFFFDYYFKFVFSFNTQEIPTFLLRGRNLLISASFYVIALTGLKWAIRIKKISRIETSTLEINARIKKINDRFNL